MAVLELDGIVKDYGAVRAIHGIDLKIEDGKFCVFVGPSGCGKSTLLRMIAGLEEITDGELRIDGERVNEQRASERGLAMVFQPMHSIPYDGPREPRFRAGEHPHAQGRDHRAGDACRPHAAD